MNDKKSQAALEFLTTYAWAFMLILLTIGALYYFGIFDFDKFLPQKCVFPSQFDCLDFAFIDDEVRFKLINNIGEEVFISSFKITNDASNPLSCTEPSNQGNWIESEERDFVFSGCTDGAFFEGERTEVKINMTYYAINTPSQPVHQVNGKITGIVG